MSKNNKKTMNERTHNSFEIYKKNENSNSNNDNTSQEFAEEFGSTAHINATNKNKNKQSLKNK
ncbi:hypothetical protein ACFVR1_04940 [Psychrobacillus sp. NPDC058041]|uniref:hypothetical protein n=1 Tax=Psychrobacillus sp. NPDC058041 TaxID=3346310 RepID=UPI0036DDC2BE